MHLYKKYDKCRLLQSKFFLKLGYLKRQLSVQYVKPGQNFHKCIVVCKFLYWKCKGSQCKWFLIFFFYLFSNLYFFCDFMQSYFYFVLTTESCMMFLPEKYCIHSFKYNRFCWYVKILPLKLISHERNFSIKLGDTRA